MEITTDQILEALRSAMASGKSDGGHTTEELAEMLGCSMPLIHKALRRLARDGMIVVGRARRVSIDQRPYLAPVYRVNKPKKKP